MIQKLICAAFGLLLSAITQAQVADYTVGFEVTGMIADDPVTTDYSVELSLNTNLDSATVFDDVIGGFPTQLPDGSSYTVAVDFQPINQTCTVVSGGSGTIAGANPIAQVQCTPNATPPPTTTPTAVPVMPLWLLGLMAVGIAGVASIRFKRARRD
jgi:hypothetical protein